MTKNLLAIVMCVWAVVGPAADQASPGGMWLDSRSFTRQPLPIRSDVEHVLADLEYEPDSVPKVFAADLNGDTAIDYVVEGASSLCGNGGCPYALLNGRTKEHLGTFFGGSLLLLNQRINGFPVAQSFARTSVDSGTFTTYVLDGKKYQTVSAVEVSGTSLQSLLKQLEVIRGKKDK
jgi:hypothetical protein